MYCGSRGTCGHNPLIPTLFTEMKKNCMQIVKRDKTLDNPTELQEQSSSRKGLISNKGKWPFSLNYYQFFYSIIIP